MQKWKKGNGEMIGFAIAGLVICSIFLIMVSFLQLSVGLNSISKALNVVGRSVAVCTSKEDAETQAQRVAENSITYINVEDPQTSVDYVTAGDEWQSGVFVRVKVSGMVKTMTPFINRRYEKNVLICIENTNGSTINLPEYFAGRQIVFGGTFTYYEHPSAFGTWSLGTNQRKLYDRWVAAGRQYDSNGIAIYQGNYLVAVSSTFGSVGDRIQINLRNGTILNCIIADIKNSGDANYTQYGHAYGNKIYVVEPEIKRGQAGASGGTVTNWIPQWNSPPTKIINKGSVLN